MKEMKILNESIEIESDYIEIEELKFLKDNPRVYACTHGEQNFNDLPEKEQQDTIYKKLLQETSVKNLIPEIKRHGGLIESILIRHDTKEVIEGNSRLAVYRKLKDEQYTKEDKYTDEWDMIPCDIISGLTERQQAAFLNQIHVKGKTQWSAYEKANFAYVRKERKWKVDDIAKLFGETPPTIYKRIKVIDLMKQNGDTQRSHFSYYDVLVRNAEILKKIDKGELKRVLEDIKQLGEKEENNSFTAQELRKKLPAVLKKPKISKKYEKGEIDLEQAYQRAKISQVQDNVRLATALLEDVSMEKIRDLNQDLFNAFKQAVRKLTQKVDRINKIIQEINNK